MALQSVVYASVSQTVGRDPKVGRQVLASGSRKCVEKYDIFCHYFILVSLKFIFYSVKRATTFYYGWAIIRPTFIVVRAYHRMNRNRQPSLSHLNLSLQCREKCFFQTWG